jgi:hypothetical protein
VKCLDAIDLEKLIEDRFCGIVNALHLCLMNVPETAALFMNPFMPFIDHNFPGLTLAIYLIRETTNESNPIAYFFDLLLYHSPMSVYSQPEGFSIISSFRSVLLDRMRDSMLLSTFIIKFKWKPFSHRMLSLCDGFSAEIKTAFVNSTM